ncbi:MAG: ribosome small subunit-dependent GTPase A [Chitinivibrionales bacterium]|nr:ribosome small subunit-dependent GTPase A [Chitinivibrionales bacterium]
MKNEGLESLGYNEWFRAAHSNFILNGFSLARIIEVNKGNFRVADGLHEMLAELSGKLLFAAKDSTYFPTIGDWVVVQALDNYSFAIIHNILPRKTVLKRKEPGRKVEFQLIASNIDCGLILQSADSLNLKSLERYLVMLNESGIRPMAVISKVDLLSASELAEIQKQIAKASTKNVFISNVVDRGIESLSVELEPRKTYCLLGPSGVGKTSLLNRLLGDDRFKVSEVREKDGKGRHTTVKRQLICLESGSIFIDTPGMRELGNFEIAEGLEQTFEEISLYGAKCRFRDCTHIHKEGCAIIEAVELGKIDSEKYQNYLKLKKESEFYEMSYLEKRKKDKAFGKMIKNYNKMKRNSD